MSNAKKAPKSAFKEGHTPWNKGLKNWMSKDGLERMIEKKSGKKQSSETIRLRMMHMHNEEHHMWKGEKASYTAWHRWVIRHKGKAKNYNCVDCGKQAQTWSNIDHEYHRNLDDYQPRCISCHRKYDIANNQYRPGFASLGIRQKHEVL